MFVLLFLPLLINISFSLKYLFIAVYSEILYSNSATVFFYIITFTVFVKCTKIANFEIS